MSVPAATERVLGSLASSTLPGPIVQVTPDTDVAPEWGRLQIVMIITAAAVC